MSICEFVNNFFWKKSKIDFWGIFFRFFKTFFALRILKKMPFFSKKARKIPQNPIFDIFPKNYWKSHIRKFYVKNKFLTWQIKKLEMFWGGLKIDIFWVLKKTKSDSMIIIMWKNFEAKELIVFLIFGSLYCTVPCHMSSSVK